MTMTEREASIILRKYQLRPARSHVVEQELQHEVGRARRERYARETRLLLRILMGEFAFILPIPSPELTVVTDGEERMRVAGKTLDELVEHCMGASEFYATVELPDRPGDPQRATFWGLFGNGPGELVADYSWSHEEITPWADAAHALFSEMTEGQ